MFRIFERNEPFLMDLFGCSAGVITGFWVTIPIWATDFSNKSDDGTMWICWMHFGHTRKVWWLMTRHWGVRPSVCSYFIMFTYVHRHVHKSVHQLHVLISIGGFCSCLFSDVYFHIAHQIITSKYVHQLGVASTESGIPWVLGCQEPPSLAASCSSWASMPLAPGAPWHGCCHVGSSVERSARRHEFRCGGYNVTSSDEW
jgi:hypothetical protein